MWYCLLCCTRWFYFLVCGWNLVCDHSNEHYWAVLSCGTVYYALQVSTFKSGWNTSVWPFKSKLLAISCIKHCSLWLKYSWSFNLKALNETSICTCPFLLHLPWPSMPRPEKLARHLVMLLLKNLEFQWLGSSLTTHEMKLTEHKIWQSLSAILTNIINYTSYRRLPIN